jgi:hypothetical protein
MGKQYLGIAFCDQCGEEIERVDLWDIHGTHLGYPQDWWPEDVCGSEECQAVIEAEREAEANRVKVMTAEAAKQLLSNEEELVIWGGLSDEDYTHIDLDAAEMLIRHKELNVENRAIRLKGLKEISPEVATLFREYKGKRLGFGKNFVPSVEVAKLLSKCECELWFSWEYIPGSDEGDGDPIAEALSHHKGGLGISVDWMEDISCEWLSNYEGKWLGIGDCGEQVYLSNTSAEFLAKCKYLILDLSTVDKEAREILKDTPGCYY